MYCIAVIARYEIRIQVDVTIVLGKKRAYRSLKIKQWLFGLDIELQNNCLYFVVCLRTLIIRKNDFNIFTNL